MAISSYNVVPKLRRATDGDVAAIGPAAVQIAFTIILRKLGNRPHGRGSSELRS